MTGQLMAGLAVSLTLISMIAGLYYFVTKLAIRNGLLEFMVEIQKEFATKKDLEEHVEAYHQRK